MNLSYLPDDPMIFFMVSGFFSIPVCIYLYLLTWNPLLINGHFLLILLSLLRNLYERFNVCRSNPHACNFKTLLRWDFLSRNKPMVIYYKSTSALKGRKFHNSNILLGFLCSRNIWRDIAVFLWSALKHQEAESVALSYFSFHFWLSLYVNDLGTKGHDFKGIQRS